jgi:DNA gyrase subunit B
MRQGQQRAVLTDCAVHGAQSGAELFIVEGESAARSVVAVRSARTQAVLPLQGKPLNAWRAPAAKVREHALYAQLATALGLADATCMAQGAAPTWSQSLRFERVVLLLDPDADGIHIGALVQLYFKRFAPVFIDEQRLWLARAPMFIVQPGTAGAADGRPVAGLPVAGPTAQALPTLAYTPAQGQTLRAQWQAATGQAPTVQSVRGLASLAPQTLARLCVDPATRQLHCITQAAVQAAVDVFGAVDG